MSYEDHHVWPLGYHGPDIKGNLVRICPNAHSEAHHLLNLLLRNKAHDLGSYSPAVRVIARRGYDAVMAYSQALAESAKPT